MTFALAPGTLVAGFRIERLIGAGATGSVYLATRVADGGQAALKLLAPELARDERFRQRFLREAKLAAALDEQHVVRTLASGDSDGLLYLAMEYVEGSDLREILRRERRLEPARALDLVGQAAEALDAAHSAGLVHRDVKPGNILVAKSPEGERAFVCDFGLARHVSSVSSLTGDRGFVGTIDYVPPEQIEGGTIDRRADIYSLGCVLYECLAGVRPFERETELSVVYAHLIEAPPAITDVRPELPAALNDVFATALAKSPDDRYESCGELVRSTRAALRGETVRQRARRSRSRMLVAASALAVSATAATVALLLSFGGASNPRSPSATLAVAGNSIALIDVRSRRLARAVRFESAPSDVAFGRRSAWVALAQQQLVARVDAKRGKLTGRVKLPFVPGRIASAGDSAWLTEDGGPHIAQVGPQPKGRLGVLRVLAIPTVGPRVSSPAGIAVGAGSVWVARGAHVARVDPRTGRVLHLFRTPVTSNWVVYANGSIYAADAGTGVIFKIDPVTNRRSARALLHGWISDLAVGNGSVWAPVVPDGVVFKLSLDDLSVQGQIDVGSDPESVSVGAGSLWVASTIRRAVIRVALATGAQTELRLGADPDVARYRGGVVWTAAAPVPPGLPALKSRQEIRIPLSRADFGPLDPAVPANADRYQREYATCANLLSYADSAGPRGRRLRPEVASAMPTVSADGRTYTFRIRRGFRFSPPSGEPLTAETFRYSLERAFSPVYGHQSPAMSILPDVVGGAAYNQGKAKHISGIEAHRQTLSIRLVRPAGDLPTRLSETFFCPVPIGTQATAAESPRPLPSAGPYYVATSDVGQTVLLQNPYYHGRRPRRIERIVYTAATPTGKAIALLDAGAAEYIDGYTSDADPAALSPDSLAARRYGPASRAAKRGRQRYFVIPVPGVDVVAFNTRRPLFRSARMRRAVNYAINRRALAAVYGEPPTDRYIPPAVSSFPRTRVYPFTPDIAKARRLAGTRRRSAALYLCSPAEGTRVAQILRANLATIGIAVRIERSLGCLNGPETAKLAAADLVLLSILDPEFDPSVWVKATLGTPSSQRFWTPAAFRRRIESANALRGDERIRTFARLEEALVRVAAPFAAFGAFATAEYFSPRVGCKLFQSHYHFVDLGALCVKR